MTRYADLIAKLEAAPEGSRELDAEIWYETHTDKERLWSLSGLNAQRKQHTEETLRREVMRSPRTFGFCNPRHRYSTSLDAALTLVPDGWWWRLEQWGFAKPDGRRLYSAATFKPKQEMTAHGRSPDLALCIAALKARAAEEGER